MMYQMSPDIVAGLAGADIDGMKVPAEAEYIAAYCERRGHLGVDNWDFYIAFNFSRFAAIFYGITGRGICGTAASAHAKERADAFPRLAKLAFNAMLACR